FAARDYENSNIVQYLFRRHTTMTDYDYASHVWAISADYQSRWEHFEEPEIEKVIQRLKLYRLGTAINNFTVRINTYRNWSTSTADTDTTATFASTTSSYEQIVNLRPNKARA